MTALDAVVQTRRLFLSEGVLLGTGLIAAQTQAAGQATIMTSRRPDAAYELPLADNHILTSCLQCNTGCGIRCKLQNGMVTKIDGNPYSPWTLLPHLPYATPVDDAAPVDGAICPKGQAGMQTAYDPYRLRRVLKRAGKRGENKWISIPFDQAIREICEGGRLFRYVPGEENRVVEGLASLVALRGPALAKAMDADVQAIWKAKDRASKQALVEAFKDRHAAHLDSLINPDHPDLGPKNNQIVLAWGRLKDGRGDLSRRFAAALGTVNAHGHTTVCQGSLYFTCKAISEQYIGGTFTEEQKFYWQADLEHSRFVLLVRANPFEGNYGPPNQTVRLTDNLVSGRMKIAVADPRFSKLASKAWKWLPLKPGTDGALAVGFIRWMLDNRRFDATFLACANKAAARAAGETAWTNATWLVVIKDGQPGKLLRAADPKIDSTPLRDAERRTFKDPASGQEKEYDEKFMVVMVNGQPTAVDPNDDKNPVVGDLVVDATLPDGTRVKSGLQVLLESARQRTVAEWATIAGIRERDLIAVAEELTRYGKAVAVDVHRGPVQHTNGFYNVLAWMTVNMLLGNFDTRGGMIKPATWDTKGRGKLFDITAHPGKVPAFRVSSMRHGVDYERTTLFAGYPARRNWYPLASDVHEEIVPSIGDAHPYPVKCLFLDMGAPTYALPAGHTNIAVLADVNRLPLFIACDIVIGPASMHADYTFPDLSFLERWEFQGSHPNIPHKVQSVRQPVIAPVPEECTIFGQRYPISLEAMILAIAERLGLPGLGVDGLEPDRDLKHPDDRYLRQVANLTFSEKPDGSHAVPDADDREIEVFLKAPPPPAHERLRFRPLAEDRRGSSVVQGRLRPQPRRALRGPREGLQGRPRHPRLRQTAQPVPREDGRDDPRRHGPTLPRCGPIQDVAGREPNEIRRGYDLVLIAHRVISQTKSRTVADPWLLALMPENTILINPRDADRLGLRYGQRVCVVSAINPAGEWDLSAGVRRPMVGKIRTTQTIPTRRGLVRAGIRTLGHGGHRHGDRRTRDPERGASPGQRACQRRHADRPCDPEHVPVRPCRKQRVVLRHLRAPGIPR